MFLLGTLGLAGASGGLNYLAQDKTNEANAAMSREQMDWQTEESKQQRNWSSAEAEINRGFQERMSNTAVARRMQDLKNSGINPIIAGGFNSSTPSGGTVAGSSASAVSRPDLRNPLEAGINSAINSAGMAMQISKLRSEVQLINDQAFQARGTGRAQQSTVGKNIAERDKTLQNIRKDEFKTKMEQFKERVGQPILGQNSSGARSVDHLNIKVDKVFNNMLDKLLRAK